MRLVALEKAKLDSIVVPLVGSIFQSVVTVWSVKMGNVSRTEVEAWVVQLPSSIASLGRSHVALGMCQAQGASLDHSRDRPGWRPCE
jgi:hypothetical protein